MEICCEMYIFKITYFNFILRSICILGHVCFAVDSTPTVCHSTKETPKGFDCCLPSRLHIAVRGN